MNDKYGHGNEDHGNFMDMHKKDMEAFGGGNGTFTYDADWHEKLKEKYGPSSDSDWQAKKNEAFGSVFGDD